jgi:hypothetical protein
VKPVVEDELHQSQIHGVETPPGQPRPEDAAMPSPGLREPYSQLNLNDTDEVDLVANGESLKIDPKNSSSARATPEPIESQTTTTSGVFSNTQSNSPSTKKNKKKRKSSGPPPKKYNPDDFRIVILDSMGMTHSKTVSNIKQYIAAEGKDKRGMDINPTELSGINARGIPQQKNFSDCGVYLCGYVDKFMQDPKAFGQKLLAQEFDVESDWPDMDPNHMRKNIREMLQDIYADQEKQRAKEKRIRREEKRSKKAAGQSAASSPPASSQVAEPRSPRVLSPQVLITQGKAAQPTTKRPAEVHALPSAKEGSPSPAKRSRQSSPLKHESTSDDGPRLDFNPTLANARRDAGPGSFFALNHPSDLRHRDNSEEFRGFSPAPQSPDRPVTRGKQ